MKLSGHGAARQRHGGGRSGPPRAWGLRPGRSSRVAGRVPRSHQRAEV